MVLRQRLRIASALENILRAELNRRIIARMPATGLNGLVEQVRQQKIDPYTAANTLLADMF
jgi:hypothetical protein